MQLKSIVIANWRDYPVRNRHEVWRGNPYMECQAARLFQDALCKLSVRKLITVLYLTRRSVG